MRLRGYEALASILGCNYLKRPVWMPNYWPWMIDRLHTVGVHRNQRALLSFIMLMRERNIKMNTISQALITFY